MKRIMLAFSAVSFLVCAPLFAGGKAGLHARTAEKFGKYNMDNGYFSCVLPADWEMARDKEQDERYKIFEIRVDAPKSDKAPASIFVTFYANDNKDFNGYKDYIDSNSSNVAGETKSSRENYEAARKIRLAGRKGFQLGSECLRYLNPESKSDESVLLKEKIYVLPAKNGFYVLRFNAPKTLFAEYQPVFEKVAKSFKGKP